MFSPDYGLGEKRDKEIKEEKGNPLTRAGVSWS